MYMYINCIGLLHVHEHTCIFLICLKCKIVQLNQTEYLNVNVCGFITEMVNFVYNVLELSLSV